MKIKKYKTCGFNFVDLHKSNYEISQEIDRVLREEKENITLEKLEKISTKPKKKRFIIF